MAEMFTRRWQGTVRGLGVILEELNDSFTVQIVGAKSRIFRYDGDGLFGIGPDGEEAGFVTENHFLFVRLFALKPQKGKWPWEEVRKNPEFMAFLGEYRNFKRIVDKGGQPLSREEAQPFIDHMRAAMKKTERRSL